MLNKIGYLIPQFPGQTHSMFWRERAALKKLGIETSLISTRQAPHNKTTHEWAESAIKETFYLFPPRPLYLLKGMGLALKNIKKVWHLFRTADLPSIKDKLKYFASFFLGMTLASFVQKENLKHIHVHSSGESLNIVLFAQALTPLTYSITLHNPLIIFGANQRQKWEHASFAIIVSDDLFKTVTRDMKGFLPKTLFSSAMGVDLEKFKRTERPKNETTQLFSCGRIHQCKGRDILLEALSQIKSPYHLRIAGGVDNNDPHELEKLQNLVKKYQLEKKVEFLGPISEEKVIQELNQADAFVLTSRVETLGVAFMEAMAMHLPVVATDVGGVRELVINDENGYLIEPENIEQARKSIERLIQNPELREKFGEAGRRKVEESFSSDVSAKKIIEGLKQL